MPALSVVIPTFNTAAMTWCCCRAVLVSMPASTEVIVADDGSSDGTAELLARDLSKVRVVRLDVNRGFAAAANRGVAATSGEIILLLNSDAVVEASALAALLAAFDADAKLGVAGAQLLDGDGTPQWSGGPAPKLLWMAAVVSGAGAWAGRLRRNRSVEETRDVDWVSGAAMAFRREVWDQAGPLDERFRFYCQDIEFCVRAHDAGWRVRVVPEVRVVHAVGGTIAEKSALRHDPERLWNDLLMWGTRRYGRAWGRVARVVLILAAWARIAVRLPFRRDATTDALVRAARSLTQSDS